MEHLSVRLTSLSSSATLAMSQKSNELKAQGVDVINLSVGEPDFFTPDPIKVAAKKAIDNNFSFYTPVPGYMDLRKAIVAKLKKENGLDFTVDQIIVSNGAKQSICNALLCLINPGDEVIVPPAGSCGVAKERMEGVDKELHCYDWFFCTKQISKAEVESKLGK